MSKKPEQAFWQWLRRAIGKSCYLERIENRVGMGTPDLHGVFMGADGMPRAIWVELKSAQWSTQGTLRVPAYKPHQAAWHERYLKAGGKSIYLVETDTGEVLIVPGRLAGQVDGMMKAAMPQGVTAVSKKAKAPEIIAAILAV